MVGLTRVPGTGGGMAKGIGDVLLTFKDQVVEQYDKAVAAGGDPSTINLDDLDLPANPLTVVPDEEYHPATKQQQEEIKKEKNKPPKKRKPHSPEKTAQNKGYNLGEKTSEKVAEDTDWGLVGTIAVGALVVFYLMYQASSSGR